MSSGWTDYGSGADVCLPTAGATHHLVSEQSDAEGSDSQGQHTQGLEEQIREKCMIIYHFVCT